MATQSEVGPLHMVPLTDRTLAIIAQLFIPAERGAAAELLATECADRLPLYRPVTPEGLERVQFAALRLSGGRLTQLRAAVDLAREDWRDLLVAAGFAHEVQAHLRWAPIAYPAETQAAWRRGERIAGIGYGRLAPVRIATGWARGEPGRVEDLLRLDPEPTYAVVIGDGRTLEIPESIMRSASDGPSPPTSSRTSHDDAR